MQTLILIGLLATASAYADDTLHYKVTVTPTLDRLDAEVCFGSWTPERLVSRLDESRHYLIDPTPSRGTLRVEKRRGQIRLYGAEAGDCISYGVDLADAVSDQAERMIMQTDDAVVMSSGVWLWRPRRLPDGVELIIEFDLPTDMRASVPWDPVEGERAVFRLARTPIEWRDLTAIGRLDLRDLDVGGASLRLAVLDAGARNDADDMDTWISEAAGAVSRLYGRFPLQQPQVLVVPIGQQSEAVPWAQVLRGGGAAAHFFVDPHRPLSEFREDWTATHELSHMLLPYVGRGDAWLSEGFASYYQNVLRARAGMIDEDQAWLKLYAGFGRGRRGSGDASLKDASRNMRESGGYMRVYWSGAAIALMADVALRRESGGRISLDLAMAELADCCLPSDRTWSAREIFARLDDITDSDVFARLYREHVGSRRFPDLDQTSALLGITERGSKLHFSSESEAATLRAAIMSRPALVAADSKDGSSAAHATP